MLIPLTSTRESTERCTGWKQCWFSSRHVEYRGNSGEPDGKTE